MLSESDLYCFYDGDPAPIVEFLEQLASWYRLTGNLSVLDIGCGPGRLLLPLADLGWRVVGMEPHADYAAAATRLASGHDEVDVRAGGFGDISADREFDLITAVNDPFAYLLTPAERIDALARCFAALRPGGVLFIDIPNFMWILKNYREPHPLTAEIDGLAVTRRASHEFDFHDAIWTHIDDFEISSEGATSNVSSSHRFAMMSFPEVAGAMSGAGFSDIATYRSYSARGPEHLDGPRIMVSAQRPT